MNARTRALVNMGKRFLNDKFQDRLSKEDIQEISESFITFCSLEFTEKDLACYDENGKRLDCRDRDDPNPNLNAFGVGI